MQIDANRANQMSAYLRDARNQPFIQKNIDEWTIRNFAKKFNIHNLEIAVRIIERIQENHHVVDRRICEQIRENQNTNTYHDTREMMKRNHQKVVDCQTGDRKPFKSISDETKIPSKNGTHQEKRFSITPEDLLCNEDKRKQAIDDLREQLKKDITLEMSHKKEFLLYLETLPTPEELLSDQKKMKKAIVEMMQKVKFLSNANHLEQIQATKNGYQKKSHSTNASSNNFTVMERYETIDRLGEGAYGIVYRARDLQTGGFVAIKKLRVSNHDEGIPACTLREISLLQELEHDHVVKLLDLSFNDTRIYLIFEFVDKDLKDYMNCVESLPCPLVKHYMHQILEAVKYCHSKRILHRDIKPQNILIDRRGTLKLADFGLARAYQLPLQSYTHEVVTLWYRAPEVLLGGSIYGTSVDTWSIGCIFAEMVIHKPVFPGNSEIDQLFQIFRKLGTPNESLWPGVSHFPHFKKSFPKWKIPCLAEVLHNFDKEGIDLLEQMLNYCPRTRISARKALQHPYFNDTPIDYNKCSSKNKKQKVT